MQNIDCLLIHTPKFDNFYKPIGSHSSINNMPIGLLGMASFLDDNGLTCQIIHQGVELLNNKNWQLKDTLSNKKIPVIGLSLHWHYQAYDVIKSCKKIKEILPEAFIVLGGFTASFYHDEIVKNYDCVDSVIRGDGEVPLLQLVRAVKNQNKNFSKIPNLTWKKRNIVVENKVTYVPDAEILNNMCFANMKFLNNYQLYIDNFAFPYLILDNVPKEFIFKHMSINKKLFNLCLGRGCSENCTWCGGSHSIQKERISHRIKVIYRDYDAVINDIKKAIEYNYEGLYISFDPTPGNLDYHVGLFERICEEGLAGKLGCCLGLTGIGTKKFFDAFEEAFNKDLSELYFSPESGNEEIRRKNKGFYYSNKDLIKMVDYVVSKNIEISIYFTFGVPGENEKKIQDTYNFRKEIIKRYGRNYKFPCFSIDMEPGAPWNVNPEKYGIVCSRKTFQDFYDAHSGKPGTTELGYYIPDYFNKRLDEKDPEKDFATRIQNLKCKLFCFMHPEFTSTNYPFVGRLFCKLFQIVSFLKRLKPEK